MQFFKMHSMGNDFVVFGTPSNINLPTKNTISALCDRHYGIGADCAVCIGKSQNSDYFMHVYNPDGTEVEMCGNALKCSTQYVHEKGYFKRNLFSIETQSGIKKASVHAKQIIAEIGKPNIVQHGILEFYSSPLPYVQVSMGNPHCIIFAANLSDEQFLTLGPFIENHPDFPNGTNVEFANILDESNIEMRVWERGIGETFSCITGSCACVAAASVVGSVSDTVSVHQYGGIAEIKIDENGIMFNKGKVTTVFQGTINTERGSINEAQ